MLFPRGPAEHQGGDRAGGAADDLVRRAPLEDRDRDGARPPRALDHRPVVRYPPPPPGATTRADEIPQQNVVFGEEY
jgi:hypothetical protein